MIASICQALSSFAHREVVASVGLWERGAKNGAKPLFLARLLALIFSIACLVCAYPYTRAPKAFATSPTGETHTFNMQDGCSCIGCLKCSLFLHFIEVMNDTVQTEKDTGREEAHNSSNQYYWNFFPRSEKEKNKRRSKIANNPNKKKYCCPLGNIFHNKNSDQLILNREVIITSGCVQ